MMDQTLADDYWFDQFTEPRIVSVMVDLLGPDLDFHNGKIRNKPPGFFCEQSWHQDWPYERHTISDLAAVITYLDPTDFESGATEVVPGSHREGEFPTCKGHTIADELIAPERPGRSERATRRCGDYSRAGRTPGRAQLHAAGAPRYYQRIQKCRRYRSVE